MHTWLAEEMDNKKLMANLRKNPKGNVTEL